MDLRHRLRSPETLMRVGAASLLLASLSRWFLHPAPGLLLELADGATGTLYGVAIAAMLASLRARSRASGCPADAR